ncbi:MAG: DNA-3-methyladenine glycosylase, partial [Chlamydiales bacterium]
GTVTQALGITRAYYGLSLSSSKIWVEDRAIKIPAKKIEITPRIGVDYAQEDALLPWRFLLSAEKHKES